MELDQGTGTRTMCPYCNGGSSKEKSLSLYRSNNLTAYATCFRASCDFGTQHLKLYNVNGELLTSQTRAKNLRVPKKAFRLERLKISVRLRDLIRSKYSMTDDKMAYARIQETKDGRAIFPIFSPQRKTRGDVLRVISSRYAPPHMVNPGTIPKAMNMVNSDDTVLLSWYFKDRHQEKASDTLIITEDIPSALRCIDYCDSVALLGTKLGPDKIKEIKSMRYKNVYLCLDPDANRIIANHIRRNAGILNMKTKFLSKDLKDTNPQELDEFMRGIEL